MTGTPSQRQLRRREASWGGSRRQILGPRNTKFIRRRAGGERASDLEARKSSGPACRRWNGREVKVTCLTPGALTARLWLAVAARSGDGWSGVSRGREIAAYRDEGPNIWSRRGANCSRSEELQNAG